VGGGRGPDRHRQLARQRPDADAAGGADGPRGHARRRRGDERQHRGEQGPAQEQAARQHAHEHAQEAQDERAEPGRRAADDVGEGADDDRAQRRLPHLSARRRAEEQRVEERDVGRGQLERREPPQRPEEHRPEKREEDVDGDAHQRYGDRPNACSGAFLVLAPGSGGGGGASSTSTRVSREKATSVLASTSWYRPYSVLTMRLTRPTARSLGNTPPSPEVTTGSSSFTSSPLSRYSILAV